MEPISLELEYESEQIVCLGLNFNSHEERRSYFRNQLRMRLSELKGIEGYPIADDDVIINLSDPPYYTPCPNPWVDEVIREWESKKIKKDRHYSKFPYVDDVVEGKSNSLYRAHSYHTKVPHRAIMKFLLHYTEPGDIVFDGFCGTGMTGVAANFCGDEKELAAMGLSVDEDGNVIDYETSTIISKFGKRHAVISDLAPAATFIAANYNFTESYADFSTQIDSVINQLKREFSWMYQFKDESGEIGTMEAIVWSDVFICNHCGKEINFWKDAIDKEVGEVKKDFLCPHCGVATSKRYLDHKLITELDPITKEPHSHAFQVPVLISGLVNGKRVKKEPSEEDLQLLNRIMGLDIDYTIIDSPLPPGEKSQEANISHGFSSVHHYYTRRSLIVLNRLYELSKDNRYLLFALTGISNRASLMNRIHLKNFYFGGGGWNPGEQKGTVHVSSVPIETSIIKLLTDRKRAYKDLYSRRNSYSQNLISTSSATNLSIPDNSIDYVFIDPPFGANLNYSELNFFWESWIKVRTNNEQEAIENITQNKGLAEYHYLMKKSFDELYRILKPNHWMTVEFSNTNAAVWNAIQSAINEAGFVIANVSALNKKQGGFNAIVGTTAVKQDLVMSAYKPSENTITAMINERNSENTAWIFINEHLQNLPLYSERRGEIEVVTERTPRILYDRMVAYHVQSGLPVPISSADFQYKIANKFIVRDGMIFLESQVAEYDRIRIQSKEFAQLSLFVSDENSAIEWLRQQLLRKPQTRQELHPQFMKEIQHIAKHEDLPELDELLRQNFLEYYEGTESVPSQIKIYLTRAYHDLRGLDNNDRKLKEKAKNRWYVPNPNQQSDLEKIREKNLLREFKHYVEEVDGNKKKLKIFRTEAIRVGFKQAWTEKDYEKIVKVGERLLEKVILEDDKLSMYFDNALMRLGL